MVGRDVIVIGGSAGSLPPLIEIVQRLPGDLAASVFVVVHIGANTDSTLPQMLSKAGKLPATWADNRRVIERGHIYVAPPDQHLVLEGDYMRVIRGPKENHTRPAIDPLFRSAALSHGNRVIGVILSGYRDDGTAGLLAIKDRGGIAIIQDPAEAVVPTMPWSALVNVPIDHRVSAKNIAEILLRYDPPQPGPLAPAAPLIEFEHKLTAMDTLLADRRELESVAAPSAYSCPECGGVLYQLRDNRLLRFRCVQAHACSPLSLLSELADIRDGRLQEAARALTEEAELSREIAEKVPALVHASVLVGNSGVLAQQARELRAFLATDVPGERGMN